MNVSRETSEPEEDEVSETLRIIEPMRALEPEALPQSPLKLYRAAKALGWDIAVWYSSAEVAPVMYVNSSEEKAKDKNQHVAGEVKSEGYLAKFYTVEARDPASREIGFRAHFTGKSYQSGKPGTGGGFTRAWIADPVGFPRVLKVQYKLIEPTRDNKFETEKSYTARVKVVVDQIADANKNYNDEFVFWAPAQLCKQAGQLDAFLDEWRPYFV